MSIQVSPRQQGITGTWTVFHSYASVGNPALRTLMFQGQGVGLSWGGRVEKEELGREREKEVRLEERREKGVKGRKREPISTPRHGCLPSSFTTWLPLVLGTHRHPRCLGASDTHIDEVLSAENAGTLTTKAARPTQHSELAGQMSSWSAAKNSTALPGTGSPGAGTGLYLHGVVSWKAGSGPASQLVRYACVVPKAFLCFSLPLPHSRQTKFRTHGVLKRNSRKRALLSCYHLLGTRGQSMANGSGQWGCLEGVSATTQLVYRPSLQTTF